MPYASDAQRKKFHALLAEGKIFQATVDEFDQASKGMILPTRVEKKVASQIKTGTPLHSILNKSRKSSAAKKRRK